MLQDEFLNARGAIARFGRGSIEIRVIDIQECPAADLSVLQVTAAVLKALTEEKWCSCDEQKAVEVDSLHAVLLDAIERGELATISDPSLLRLFGYTRSGSCTLQELWMHLYQATSPAMESDTQRAFENILDYGPLARRIQKRLAVDSSMMQITDVACDLCDCLASGHQFGIRRR